MVCRTGVRLQGFVSMHSTLLFGWGRAAVSGEKQLAMVTFSPLQHWGAPSSVAGGSADHSKRDLSLLPRTQQGLLADSAPSKLQIPLYFGQAQM